MKTIIKKSLPVLIVLFLSFTITFAQDAKKAEFKSNKILTDTTLLVATEITMQPGEKSDVHTHPAHFFYALTDGKLKVNYSDGKSEIFEMKAGEGGYSAPERPHTAENAGKKTMKFLIVELKEHPYKEK